MRQNRHASICAIQRLTCNHNAVSQQARKPFKISIFVSLHSKNTPFKQEDGSENAILSHCLLGCLSLTLWVMQLQFQFTTCKHITIPTNSERLLASAKLTSSGTEDFEDVMVLEVLLVALLVELELVVLELELTVPVVVEVELVELELVVTVFVVLDEVVLELEVTVRVVVRVEVTVLVVVELLVVAVAGMQGHNLCPPSGGVCPQTPLPFPT